ncbi:hypothetical protein B0H17DRAFT_914062, partial [Mycena rosella]
ANPTQFLLPEEQKFNGTNFADFMLVFLPGIEGRGFAGYLDGTTKKPTRTTTGIAASCENPHSIISELYITVQLINPFLEEFNMHSQWLKSAILNNVINPCGLGLKMDGTPKELWDSL